LQERAEYSLDQLPEGLGWAEWFVDGT